MKINVTQEDIDNGRPGIPDSCPVARAINRQNNGDWTAFVGRHEIRFYHHDGSYDSEEYVLPWRVSRFIERFDNRRKVKPFVFEIEKNIVLGVE